MNPLKLILISGACEVLHKAGFTTVLFPDFVHVMCRDTLSCYTLDRVVDDHILGPELKNILKQKGRLDLYDES